MIHHSRASIFTYCKQYVLPLDFEQAADRHEFIREFARELGSADEDQAARILFAFFRTLRNHLTLEENFQLLAQLPLDLKSAYIEQWSISGNTSHPHTISEFIIEMVRADDTHAFSDFQTLENAKVIISKLLSVLDKYILGSELKDVISFLPQHLKKLFIKPTGDLAIF